MQNVLNGSCVNVCCFENLLVLFGQIYCNGSCTCRLLDLSCPCLFPNGLIILCLLFRFATSQYSLWVASSTWPTSPPPPSPSSGRHHHHLSGRNSVHICRYNNFYNLFSPPSLLPPLPKVLLVALPPASRAAVGAIFLTVAALTVERYVAFEIL